MSYDIRNRWTGAILYHSETANSIATAVVDAGKSRADLSGADLSGADLSGADLRRAILRRAILSGADLSGADLSGAILRRAILRRADLSGADLSGTDLSGTDLSGAILDATYITIIGSRHVLTASSREVRIGCQSHPIDWWLDHFRAVGRENGYTAEQVEEYGGHLRRIQAALAALAGEVACG